MPRKGGGRRSDLRARCRISVAVDPSDIDSGRCENCSPSRSGCQRSSDGFLNWKAMTKGYPFPGTKNGILQLDWLPTDECRFSWPTFRDDCFLRSEERRVGKERSPTRWTCQ